VNPTFSNFSVRSLQHSRGTLGMVVVAHVAAALLIVQLFEARRHIEPMPLLVTLLPAPQYKGRASSAPPQPLLEQVREVKIESLPEPEPELEPLRDPERPSGSSPSSAVRALLLSSG